MLVLLYYASCPYQHVSQPAGQQFLIQLFTNCGLANHSNVSCQSEGFLTTLSVFEESVFMSQWICVITPFITFGSSVHHQRWACARYCCYLVTCELNLSYAPKSTMYCLIMPCEIDYTNGVKQGAIVSPILFCVYLDTLLIELKKAGVWCFIGNWFVAALGYSDDVVLLAPTARAMRTMLGVGDKFASEFNVIFDAKKSKCITLNKQNYRVAQAPSRHSVLPLFFN